MSSTPGAPFGRVLTAMVTPFTADGALDLDAAQRWPTDLVDEGNDGLVVNGTTGESPTTTDAEKADLLTAVVEAVGRPSPRRRRGRHQRHAPHPRARPRGREPRRARAARRDAVLQQAAAGRPRSHTSGRRRRHRPAGHALRHPGPHRRPDRDRDAASGSPSTRGSWPTRTPRATCAARSRCIARTDLAFYSGDDALNLPLLSVGAVGVVCVVAHVVADRLAAMVDAYRAGEVAQGARDQRATAARDPRDHDPHAGRHRHQGGARPARPARRRAAATAAGRGDRRRASSSSRATSRRRAAAVTRLTL